MTIPKRSEDFHFYENPSDEDKEPTTLDKTTEITKRVREDMGAINDGLSHVYEKAYSISPEVAAQGDQVAKSINRYNVDKNVSAMQSMRDVLEQMRGIQPQQLPPITLKDILSPSTQQEETSSPTQPEESGSREMKLKELLQSFRDNKGKTGSFKTIAFYPPTTTVPMTIPSITPSTTPPNTSPTGEQAGRTIFHNTQSTPQGPSVLDNEANGGDNDADHPPAAPSTTGPDGKAPVQPSHGANEPGKGPGFKGFSVDVQRPIMNAPTPAMPRGASVNKEDRIIQLIIEDNNNRLAKAEKVTTWEPVEKTYEDDSIWE